MPEKQANTNRRGSRRRPLRSKPKVECRVGALGLGPNVARALVDLSQTGARLVATRPIADDSAVEIVLTSVWEPKPVRVLGHVVRSEAGEEGETVVCLRFDRTLQYAVWLKLTMAKTTE